MASPSQNSWSKHLYHRQKLDIQSWEWIAYISFTGYIHKSIQYKQEWITYISFTGHVNKLIQYNSPAKHKHVHNEVFLRFCVRGCTQQFCIILHCWPWCITVLQCFCEHNYVHPRKQWAFDIGIAGVQSVFFD